MLYGQNSGYGMGLMNMVSSMVPVFGRILVVMDPDDTTSENYQRMQEIMKQDPKGFIRFYTSLETAYDAAESNNNDVILLDGHSTHVIAEMLTVAKNRIHFIGMDGGGRLHGQGAKVQNTDGTAAVSVIHVTGTRNTFRNIKFIQVDDDATSLQVLTEAGESSYYKNCSFIFGNVANLDETAAYEIKMSGDSTEFHECTIGADTLVTSGARAGVAFDVVTTASKSTVWKDCIFNVCTSSADFDFIRVVATSDLHFGHIFINCVMLATISNASGGITTTVAVDSADGLNAGNMLFVNPATNATSFCDATYNDNVKVIGPIGTAATTGVAIIPT